MAVLDAFILEKAPGPLVQIDPALVRARVAFGGLLDENAIAFLALAEGCLCFQLLGQRYLSLLRRPLRPVSLLLGPETLLLCLHRLLLRPA